MHQKYINPTDCIYVLIEVTPTTADHSLNRGDMDIAIISYSPGPHELNWLVLISIDSPMLDKSISQVRFTVSARSVDTGWLPWRYNNRRQKDL